MTRRRITPLLGAACVLALCAASTASAQQRVVVLDFDGPRSQAVRAQLVTGLRQRRIRVVSRRDVDRAARRLGIRPRADEDWYEIAREMDVDAFLSGEVHRRRGWQATVQVRGPDGLMREDMRVRAGTIQRLASGVRRRVPRDLRDTLRSPPIRYASRSARSYGDEDRDDDRGDRRASRRPRGRDRYDDEDDARYDDEDYDDDEGYDDYDDEEPPDVDTSTDDIEAHRVGNLDPELFPDDEEEDYRPRRPFEMKRSPLAFSTGLTFVNRDFRYRNDTTGLPPYRMPLGPVIAFGAEWYPAAHFSDGPLADLGARLTFSRSFLMKSRGPEGVRYDTDEMSWSFGARYRIKAGPLTLVPDVAIGHHGFSVEASHPMDAEPQLASVGYTYLLGGLTFRIPLPEDLRLEIGGDYRLVFNRGEIGKQEYFPDGAARGFSVGARIAYGLGSGFELFGGVEATVYMHDFHTETTAGAVDRYIHVHTGLAWSWQP